MTRLAVLESVRAGKMARVQAELHHAARCLLESVPSDGFEEVAVYAQSRSHPPPRRTVRTDFLTPPSCLLRSKGCAPEGPGDSGAPGSPRGGFRISSLKPRQARRRPPGEAPP